MSTILLPSVRVAGRTLFGSATTYHPVGMTFGANLTVESTAQTTWRVPGTFSNLYMNITASTSVFTGTYRFRKNTANGNQVVSIPAATTGEFQDSVNTDAVVAGDLVNFSIVNGVGANSFTYNMQAVCFGATTNTAVRFTGNNNNPLSFGTASVTVFFCPAELLLNQGTEALAQFKCRTTATLKNFYVNCTSNARTSTSTLGSRKNTAAGNLLVSIPTAGTGIFEDLVNSDSLVSGDLFNYFLTTGAGAGTIALQSLSADFSTTNGKAHFISGNAFPSTAANTTVYFGLAGNDATTATEANAQVRSNFNHTASNLEIRIQANTVTAASTFRLRKNAGNVNSTISITASTTGFFEDAVNTDTLVTTDELNYQLVTGATGTSIQPSVMGYLISTSASAVKYQSGLFWSYPI